MARDTAYKTDFKELDFEDVRWVDLILIMCNDEILLVLVPQSWLNFSLVFFLMFNTSENVLIYLLIEN